MKKVLFLILTVACVSAFSQKLIITREPKMGGLYEEIHVREVKPNDFGEYPPYQPQGRTLDDIVPQEVKDWFGDNPGKGILITVGAFIGWKLLTD